MLGDVTEGNGDASLATFGDNSTYTPYPHVSPNAHALVERFPLLDNFYDPSRQSADGHNWIVQAMAPYSDDVQSPDWLRDYPSNGGDALAYQEKGHLWDTAEKAGVSVKNHGEYAEYNTFTPPGCTLNNKYTSYSSAGGDSTGGDVATSVTPLPYTQSLSCEPLWIDWYNDVLAYESGKESQLYNNLSGLWVMQRWYQSEGRCRERMRVIPRMEISVSRACGHIHSRGNGKLWLPIRAS